MTTRHALSLLVYRALLSITQKIKLSVEGISFHSLKRIPAFYFQISFDVSSSRWRNGRGLNGEAGFSSDQHFGGAFPFKGENMGLFRIESRCGQGRHNPLT
jgi:hypothetical protein